MSLDEPEVCVAGGPHEEEMWQPDSTHDVWICVRCGTVLSVLCRAGEYGIPLPGPCNVRRCRYRRLARPGLQNGND